jgi:hypothetical protein
MTTPFVGPGQNAAGYKVNSAPQIDTGRHVFQRGVATGGSNYGPPTVTAPGTVASAGTVTNSTGYDCMVYASATGGVTTVILVNTAAKLPYPGGTVVGTTPAAQTVDMYVAAGQGVAITYSGTLSWAWLAI